jgi:hypothetical protein
VTPPTVVEIADRALVLYAFTRRGTIELALGEFGFQPDRVAQAESARSETDRWIDREGLSSAITDQERPLLEAESGAWPAPAIDDAMWRREALGVLLWAIQHLDELPPYGAEFAPGVLEGAITNSGSVESFRASARLRSGDEVERAWMEADAWFGATEGRDGEDAAVASTAAERFRALSWLRDASSAPA